METRGNHREQAKTNYIMLDSRKCEACWKCMEACPNDVIGRVNLPWHKHTLIIKRDNCTGCSKCFKTCEFNAITKVKSNKDKEKSQTKNPYKRLIINAGAFFTGFLAVFSGFLIQFSYHMEQHGIIDTNKMVLNVNYSGWTVIHKISILLLSVFMILHISQHRNWYKTTIKKDLIKKNIQVFTLTTVFVLVAITGYIPWIIDLTVNDQITRKVFMEIHDKLTIVLFVLLISHIAKRLKWFLITLERI